MTTRRLGYFLLVLTTFTFASCELIGDVLEVGIGIGILIVVVVIALVLWLIKKIRR